jgi:hypothetical protein
MVNSKIVFNTVLAGLPSDTERLAFTWLITFADAQGRHSANPKVLRSLLFPLRETTEHPTAEDIKEYLARWNELDLIRLYDADGQPYLWFPKFRDNQPGLRSSRERVMTPPPPGVDAEHFKDAWGAEDGPDAQDHTASDLSLPHFQIALEWYKEYSGVTARIIRPSGQDYLKAKELMDRCEEADVRKAIAFYFKRGLLFWWAVDKKGRRQYSFAGFCSNIATILSDMDTPADATPRARHCPGCGLRRLPTSSGPCPKCGQDENEPIPKAAPRPKEIDDEEKASDQRSAESPPDEEF